MPRSSTRAAPHRGGAKSPAPRALTLRLGPEVFRQLAVLAARENRSPTNYVETLVLHDLQARAEESRVLTMRIAPEAADLDAGTLLRGDGESDGRYGARRALFDELLGLPDAD